MTISESPCAPSSEFRALPLVRLSVRLSRKLFSPLKAGVLDKTPVAELADDTADSGCALELLTLAVSTIADALLLAVSVVELLGWVFGVSPDSCQFAGVGGTGPKAVTPLGGGRRVGGDTMGSLPEGIRWTL